MKWGFGASRRRNSRHLHLRAVQVWRLVAAPARGGENVKKHRFC